MSFSPLPRSIGWHSHNPHHHLRDIGLVSGGTSLTVKYLKLTTTHCRRTFKLCYILSIYIRDDCPNFRARSLAISHIACPPKFVD
jgi:hypothetical protein